MNHGVSLCLKKSIGSRSATDIENRLLALGKSRDISRYLLSGPVVAHHGRASRVLHVRPRCTFTVLLHLRAEQTSRSTGRLHTALRAIGRVGTKVRQEAIWAVNGIRDLRGHGLV